METAKRIYLPPVSIIGPNALQELKEDLKSIKYTKVLLVTDSVLIKIGISEKVEEILKECKLDYVIFDSVNENPTVKNVNEGYPLH